MKSNNMGLLKQLIRKKAAKYLDYNNINSVGLAYKKVNGELTDEIILEFTVNSKVAPEQLESLNSPLIPKEFSIGDLSIETSVVERTYVPSFQIMPQQVVTNRKSRFQVMQPGISISNHRGTAGTLGCFVIDSTTGEKYILSNWHVLHGDSGVIGDKIVQPGPFDDNNWVPNVVGHLFRSHLGLAGDCAISTIANRSIDTSVLDLNTKPKQIAKAELGDHLIKSGRTTQVTHGIVSKVEMIIDLNYGGSTGNRKIGGFEISSHPGFPAHDNEISMGGDSGSCWLVADDNGDATDIIAGLHFAGESSDFVNEFALACNIHSVLAKLNVTL